MPYKSLFSWFLSLWIAVSPLYQAHGQQQGSNATQTTTPGNTDVTVDQTDPNKIVISSTQSALKIEIPNSEDKEIAKYSPKNLTAGFAQWSKGAGKEAIHTMQRLPRESFLFFLAIGGVTALQLFTQYADNPMAMEQHVEHSLSPVGIVGFYAFMHFNGVSTRALSKILTDKKFASYIPYMGMTAGFAAQTILSTFMADPLIKTCVATIVGNQRSAKINAALVGIEPQKACDEAFHFYAMKRRIFDIAPGLISMIGSTVASGLIQKGITKGILQISGFDISLLFIPGVGWTMAALRFAIVSTIQMGVFYYLDQGLMARPINFAWKNIIDQGDIGNRQNNIVAEVSKNKLSRWQNTQKLNIEIKRLNELSSSWRMTNLMKVYEGHQYWSDKINQLTGLYSAAYDFLSQFVDEARNSKWRISEPYRLELTEPLYGVSALGLADGHENAYFLRPTMTEPMAKENFVRVSQMLDESLRTPFEKIDFPSFQNAEPIGYRMIKSFQSTMSTGSAAQANAVFQRAKRNAHNATLSVEAQSAFSKLSFAYLARLLSPLEKKTLDAVNVKMKTTDIQKMAEAILEIRRLYAENTQGSFLTVNYKILLYNLLQELGPNPSPMKYPGQGFMNAYVYLSDKSQDLAEVKFPKMTSGYATSLISEHLLVQAVCGPDLRKNESIIQEAWGFADKFLSPMMVQQRPDICQPTDLLNPKSIYNVTIKNQMNQQSLITYVRNNLQPEVIGDKENSGFNSWWSQKVDPQLRTAYDQYAEQYSNLMVQLVKGLHAERYSPLNLGTMANNPLDSIQQTLGTQMMVLGELTKDLVPGALRTNNPEPAPIYEPSMASSETVPLFYMMLQPRTYDWINLVTNFENATEGQLAKNQKPQVANRSLVIQQEIQDEFDKMFSLINSISIVQQNCRSASQYKPSYKKICTEAISSSLSNQEINDQAQTISLKIEEWKTMLLGNPNQEVNPSVQLSKENQKLVSLLIDGMNGLVSELHLYASMPNAVSWEKIRDIEQDGAKQKFEQDTRIKMEQMKRAQSHGMGH